MIRKLLSLGICLFLSQPLAHAALIENLGIELPRAVALAQTQDKLKLNGYAVRTLWGEEVYIGALYTLEIEKRTEMLLVNDDPMAMIYYFIKDDVLPNMLKEMFIESILINNSDWASRELDKKRLLELQETLKTTLNAGDILEIQYSPQNGVLLILNGKVLQQWPHAKTFFNMILRTWVGPYPPTRAFKRAILNFPINKRRSR